MSSKKTTKVNRALEYANVPQDPRTNRVEPTAATPKNYGWYQERRHPSKPVARELCKRVTRQFLKNLSNKGLVQVAMWFRDAAEDLPPELDAALSAMPAKERNSVIGQAYYHLVPWLTNTESVPVVCERFEKEHGVSLEEYQAPVYKIVEAVKAEFEAEEKEKKRNAAKALAVDQDSGYDSDGSADDWKLTAKQRAQKRQVKSQSEVEKFWAKKKAADEAAAVEAALQVSKDEVEVTKVTPPPVSRKRSASDLSSVEDADDPDVIKEHYYKAKLKNAKKRADRKAKAAAAAAAAASPPAAAATLSDKSEVQKMLDKAKSGGK